MTRTSDPSSYARQAREHILQQLMHKRLRPGDWLDRRAIGEELKISLAPVGEAVVQLESEGILESFPRRGTRIRVPTPEEVRGQLLVREALECQAARFYCGEPVRAKKKELRALADKIENAEAYTLEQKQADIELHRALVELAGCDAITRHFDRVMQLSIFLALEDVIATPRPARNRDNHAALVNDLCTDDADEAEARMRAHIRAGKEFFFERHWNRASR
jgi:DNA-binding GntR family transcriptional regulator